MTGDITKQAMDAVQRAAAVLLVVVQMMTSFVLRDATAAAAQLLRMTKATLKMHRMQRVHRVQFSPAGFQFILASLILHPFFHGQHGK